MNQTLNKQTVLIVDDVPENIEVLSAAVKDQYRIRFALNGENALRIAASEPMPDLILLDIMMPGMDGYEVCRALKANPLTKDIPVIFVTAKGEIGEEAKGFDLGAVDYLIKPVSQLVIRARLKAQLALKQASDAMKATQARLNRALTELELILNNASLGIVTVIYEPGQRRIVRVNRATEQMFGYEPGELVGLDVRVIAPNEEEYARFGQVYNELLCRGQAVHRDRWVKRKDGQMFLTHLIGVAIDPDDLSNGVIWLVEDITERHTAQAQLQAANSELSQALDKLKRAHEELLRSEKLASLGALVAGIAHELNTPIGNAMMVASTVHDRVGEFHSALGHGIKRSELEQFMGEMSDASEILQRNMQRAGDLIFSFKQVAVDQTSSQRRLFHLVEIIAEIVVTLHPMLKKTLFRIEYEVDEHLEMDSFPGPLGQVVLNLINNSVLHGFENRPEGLVRILARRIEGDEIELKVMDNGLGIPHEHLGKIFDPFFTTRMGRGGSGLGLSIVHTIVTGILGGRLSVDSEVGHGTTFTLYLPMVAPAPKAPE